MCVFNALCVGMSWYNPIISLFMVYLLSIRRRHWRDLAWLSRSMPMPVPVASYYVFLWCFDQHPGVEIQSANPFDTPAALPWLQVTRHSIQAGKIAFATPYCVSSSLYENSTKVESNKTSVVTKYNPLLTQKEAFKLDHLHQFSSRSRQDMQSECKCIHPAIQCRHLILAQTGDTTGKSVSLLLLLWLHFLSSHTPESHNFPHSAFLLFLLLPLPLPLPLLSLCFPRHSLIWFSRSISLYPLYLHQDRRPIVSFLPLHLFQPLLFLLGCLSFSLAGP